MSPDLEERNPPTCHRRNCAARPEAWAIGVVGVTILRTNVCRHARSHVRGRGGNRRNAKKPTVCSCYNPHPEAVDRADTGAGKWTADLRNDQGLVKATGGTAVPWARGRAGRENWRDPGSRHGRARRARSDGWTKAARRAAVHRRGGLQIPVQFGTATMEIPELLALEFQTEVSCAS